jgi:carbon monoxide dehydrogenase subunit G
MGWLSGSGNQSGLERYVPVPPATAYQAVLDAAKRKFTVKSADDFTMTVGFSSGASAFTWGENFTAQVVPAEGGSTIRVQGVGKVGGQIQQNARLHKLINQLFDDVVSALRPS